MTGLLKHETKAVERTEPFAWFDRMFDEWPALFPLRRMTPTAWFADDAIRVEEYRQSGMEPSPGRFRCPKVSPPPT